MPGNSGDAAWVGEVYVFTMLGAFIGELASESFQVPNQLAAFHSDLELFNQDFSLWKFG